MSRLDLYQEFEQLGDPEIRRQAIFEFTLGLLEEFTLEQLGCMLLSLGVRYVVLERDGAKWAGDHR